VDTRQQASELAVKVGGTLDFLARDLHDIEGLLGGDNRLLQEVQRQWESFSANMYGLQSELYSIGLPPDGGPEVERQVEVPEFARLQLGQFITECQEENRRPYHDDFRAAVKFNAVGIPPEAGIHEAVKWADAISTEDFNLAVQQTLGRWAEADKEASAMIDHYEAEEHRRLPPW